MVGEDFLSDISNNGGGGNLEKYQKLLIFQVAQGLAYRMKIFDFGGFSDDRSLCFHSNYKRKVYKEATRKQSSKIFEEKSGVLFMLEGLRIFICNIILLISCFFWTP